MIVTHVQIEALTIGDRIAVMRDGLIEQVASPHDIFASPANIFVAGFIGTPQMNLIAGRDLKPGDGGMRLNLCNQDITLPLAVSAEPAAGAVGNGGDRVMRDRHAVVDFIDIYVGAYHWPAFNVADSAIVVGVFIILLDGLIIRR